MARFSVSPAAGEDSEVEIAPIEAGVDELGVGDAEGAPDVLDDVAGRRRGEGENGGPAEVVDRVP